MKRAKRAPGRLATDAVRRPRAGSASRPARHTRSEQELDPVGCAEIIELAAIGYATLSQSGAIEAINQVGARLLGRPRARLLGKRFAMLAARISRQVVSGVIAKVLAGHGRQTCDIEVDARLGAAVHLRLSALALAKRELPAVLVVFNDITDAKAREEKLERAAAAASEALRRKDEFLAVLSRALRGPLAPIRHSLFLLARVAPTSERAERAKAVIERGVRHLTRLVDDLLDLTRSTRSKLRLRREQIDFGELVRQAVLQQDRSCAAKGITIVTSLPKQRLWAYADPTRLGEAVSTLLGNVERFTLAGGRIVVTLARAGGRAKLRVGVEVRVDSTEAGHGTTKLLDAPWVAACETIERASAGGLGMGLAMLKGELELHGGSVEMETDELGRGRTIAMALPIEDPPSSSADDSRAPRAVPRKVLVIDDIPDAADSLRDALQLVGHQVEVAYDGPAGIEIARRFRPDFVLCDIEMPGMDGYEVARSFCRDDSLRGPVLIALTGHAGPEDLNRAKRAGFDEHVAKPATVECLQSLLAKPP